MRFGPDPEETIKKQDEVRFPVELETAAFTVPDQGCYRLTGVVTHHGALLLNGHYTAACSSSPSSPWYKYSDHCVVPIDEEYVLKTEASLLFYTKVCDFVN